MRKKFTIEVVVNDEIGRIAGAVGLTQAIEDGFRIYVSPEGCKSEGFELRNILAHEMGHALAMATGLGASGYFQENGWAKALARYRKDKTFRLSMEEEAWDMAKFMVDRKRSMKLHEAEDEI